MSSLTQTIDPVSSLPEVPDRGPTAMATIEVLFHSDLRRIGDRHVLGPANDPSSSVVRVIGRNEPDFVGSGGETRGLLDPCISRQQARVWWMADRGQFHVEASPDGRRAVHLWSTDGRDLGPPSASVDPGTVLAIGDRVLLLLTVRSTLSPASPALLGRSAAMTALQHRVGAVAQLNDSVLITGETGTGKELVAHALHLASRRSSHPFVALNCAALPENLIESELFGYARGAFSGATAAKAGLFASAQGGTLFLDEIGEMPLAVQAKLLRVLEVKRVRQVGSANEEPIDVRVVAATHRDLRRDVHEGRFRADLFGRIESPRIDVPALRDRREDIPLLFTHFLARRTDEQARRLGHAADDSPLAQLWREATAYPPPIPLDVFRWMLTHDWPRNVRELDKFAAEMTASVLQGSGPVVPSVTARAERPNSAPPAPPAGAAPAAAVARNRPDRAELEALLEEQSFNQTEVARVLGVPYTTLDRWMRELGVVRPRDLSLDEITTAWQQAGGDLTAAARLLRVSARGLRVRRKELGLE